MKEIFLFPFSHLLQAKLGRNERFPPCLQDSVLNQGAHLAAPYFSTLFFILPPLTTLNIPSFQTLLMQFPLRGISFPLYSTW